MAGTPRPQIVWDDEERQQTNQISSRASQAKPAPAPGIGKVIWDKAKEVEQAIFGGPSFLEQLKKEREMPGTPFNNPEMASAMAGTASGMVGNVEGKAPTIAKAVTKVAKPAAKEVAGNVNLGRIGKDLSDEGRNVIKETAETKPEMAQAQGRGKITWDETKDTAFALGDTSDTVLKREKGQAFNAEQAYAARQARDKSAENLITLAKAARNGGDEETFAFKQALARHEEIQAQVSGMTTEAGRALSQFNIPSSGALRSDAIRRMLSGGAKDRLVDIADKMSMIDDPAKAAEFATKATKATTFDKIYEVWINSLLSGPQTHVVNTVSNALTTLWTIPEAAIASGFGAGAKAGSKVYLRETAARAYGLIEGAKEGIRAAGKTLKTGDGQFENNLKIDAPHRKAIPGVAGEIIRAPTARGLAAEDDFFKAIAYRMEVNALAMRSGLDKGLKGRALAEHIAAIKLNPPEEIQLKGIQAARVLTFQQEMGQIGKGAQQMAHGTPLAYITPFIRTPANIVKFATARSPAAPLMREVRDQLAAGGTHRQEALARITLGSSVGAVIASLAAEGKVTGGGPSDPGAKATWLLDHQPYSIKLGNTWYSYSRLEPLGMILGISADFGVAADKMSEAQADEAAAIVATSIAKNLVSKIWLSTLSDLLSAFDDPDQYMQTFLRRQAGSLIPTGVATIARTMDPVQRDTQSITDTFKQRLPGLSQSLPPRRDIFGREKVNEGGLGPDIASPVYTKTDTGNKAAAEMEAHGVSGSGPTRKIESIDLSPEQYSEYTKMAGEGLQKDIEDLIITPEYQALSGDAKTKALEGLIDKHRNAARKAMIGKYPDLAKASTARTDQQKKLKAELKTLPKQPHP